MKAVKNGELSRLCSAELQYGKPSPFPLYYQNGSIVLEEGEIISAGMLALCAHGSLYRKSEPAQ